MGSHIDEEDTAISLITTWGEVERCKSSVATRQAIDTPPQSYAQQTNRSRSIPVTTEIRAVRASTRAISDRMPRTAEMATNK